MGGAKEVVLGCPIPTSADWLNTHLGHFALIVGRQKGHVVDLILDHKVLFLTLKVLVGEAVWGSGPETGRRHPLRDSGKGEWWGQRLVWVGDHTGIGTHVGLGPVDEDFAHHPEQLLCVGIGLCQPMCPGVQEGTGKVCRCPQGRGSPSETQRTSWEPKDVQWCVCVWGGVF